MYPPTKKNPEGKLRYLYEASPMAMIIEQAGGLAYSGAKRTLEHQPNEVHERVPVLLGSRGEVEKVREFVG
jgi:fructose-1,6-bisphosphatase I